MGSFCRFFFFLNHILSYILDLSPSLKEYEKYILIYWNIFIVTLYLVDSLYGAPLGAQGKAERGSLERPWRRMSVIVLYAHPTPQMPQFKMIFSKLYQILNLVPILFTCTCFSFFKIEIFESLVFCFLKLYKIEYRTIFWGFCFNFFFFFLSSFQLEDLPLYCWEIFYYIFKSNFLKL